MVEPGGGGRKSLSGSMEKAPVEGLGGPGPQEMKQPVKLLYRF